jgi:Kef-type K+ transport system membrane component KefB
MTALDAPVSSIVLSHVLLALMAVMVVGRLLGALFQRLGQPPVIGEVVGGILLGPSLLGWIAPDLFTFLLPPSATPVLGGIAQLGVILYMFLVGLELDPDALGGRLRTTVFISSAGTALPFVLGGALAWWLFPSFAPPDVPLSSFVLFIGVAMSITAFPVLARILSDQGMTRSDLGALALAAAAIGDVTAWCLLAFVVGVVQSNTGGAFVVAALTAAFVLVTFFVVRPFVLRLTREAGGREPGAGTIAFVLILLLGSALATEAIGIHALFGAFLFGAIIPHESRLATVMHRSLEHVVLLLLLPAFFAFAGLRTDIGLVSGAPLWIVTGAIVLIATVGKFGGTWLAAVAAGLGSRQAAGLGVLMNTRGLMEIIVLNVGLELGVITPTLFTMFVLMALVTTVATTPVLQRIVRR